MIKAVGSFCFVAISILNASNTFFETSKEGWFFYKDPIAKEDTNQDTKNTSNQQTVSSVQKTADYNSILIRMSIPFENEKQRQERRKKRLISNVISTK